MNDPIRPEKGQVRMGRRPKGGLWSTVHASGLYPHRCEEETWKGRGTEAGTRWEATAIVEIQEMTE